MNSWPEHAVAICLVESQLKSMVHSATEMQCAPHHSGTKHSHSNALSLLFMRCMKRSISKTPTLQQEVSYQWESMHVMDCQYWYSCCTQMSVGHGTVQYAVSGTAVVHRCQWVIALHGTQLLVQLLYTDASGSWHCMVVSGSSFIYLYPLALWIKSQFLSKVDICILDNTLLTWTTQFLCPLLKRMQLTCTAWVTLAMTVGRKHTDPVKK